MTDRVITSVENGVAEVKLNRADKHNALDLPMFEGIVAAGNALRERKDVRAVVLYGAGPSFCSGLDYPSFMAAGADIGEKLFGGDDEGANNAQMTALVWRKLPMPVICAIHGAAYGGGLQMAAGADIRIAAPDARLSIMEVKWGLIPDMGISVSLAAQIGVDKIKELTFTGRIVSGEEAAGLGLVTRTAADPLASARELAAEIASKSPDSVRASKRLFDTAWSVDHKAALALEAELQKQMFASPNQREAVAAAMQKRAGNFGDAQT